MKLDIFPKYTPYERSDDLPEVHSLSGGRSSASTLFSLINGGFGTQRNHYTLFENTGEEHESCYQFLKDIEDFSGHKITWLEYSLTEKFINEVVFSSFSYEKFQNCEYSSIAQILNVPKLRTYKFSKSPKSFWYADNFSNRAESVREVDFNSASRNGKPLIDIFLYYPAIRIMKGEGLIIPSIGNRWCTGSTKEQVGDKWLSLKGIKEYISYKGMRFDEPDRVRKVFAKNDKQNDIIYDAPLHHLKIVKIDVLMQWAAQPFDLGRKHGFIDAYGNCTKCHLKAKVKKLYLMQQGIGSRSFEQMELLANTYNGDVDAMARAHGTYSMLEKLAKEMPPITIEEVLSDEEKEISCFGCGD